MVERSYLLIPESDVGIVQRLRRTLMCDGLGERPHVLVGFSGGMDSLALLVALRALERIDLVQLTAVHVDHGVRETSEGEARQVMALADGLGVRCELWSVVAKDLARHRGVGVEEALRRERYRAFAAVSERVGAGIVATAHHQRDQAETVLLHLLRGSGLRGASSMRTMTELVVPWWADSGVFPRSLRVWRPFLDEPAAVLREFVNDFALPVVDDPTNDDPRFRRNAIRHEVLPILERVMPGAVANLAGFAALAAEDDDVLDRLATETLEAATEGPDLRRSVIRDLPIGLQRRVLRRWVLDVAPRLELSSQRVEALRRATCGREGGVRIQLGGGWEVSIARDLLRLEQARAS